jgi:hypothetical protein
MNRQDIEEFKKDISDVNGFRIKFWSAYRAVRNRFLTEFPSDKYKTDPEWMEILDSLDDMYESCIKEDMRRQIAPPFRKRFTPRNTSGVKKRIASGLYSSNKLCLFCCTPLTGRQQKYCSERCKNNAKSQRFRKNNPEKKEKSNLKYLKEIFPDDT